MQLYELVFFVKRKIRVFLWNIFFSKTFKRFGRSSSIYKPRLIQGAKYITIGSNTHLMKDAWLLALKNDDSQPELIISDDCYIGYYVHIVAVRHVEIEDRVLIADKVYISDNLHSFHDVSLPIIEQPVSYNRSVIIKRGAWIGENVCIIGASVGANSVVAANSVVTKDVPDYCVVAGAPAKVIKKYCHHSKAWMKV